MPRLILGVHAGVHDAAAALFEDYTLKAAVSLERLTRQKGDGSSHPDQCIDEVLAIAGASRQDVDAVAYSLALFPQSYYRLRGWRWLEAQYRARVRGKLRTYVAVEMQKSGTLVPDPILNSEAYQRDSGFRADAKVSFYNHHEAHALPMLFYSPDWRDALLVTADGGGDNVFYSYRHFAGGALKTIYGGHDYLLKRGEFNSVATVYGLATRALGFKVNRHEGKLTGLAATGNPVAADRIGEHFSVDAHGLVHLAKDYDYYRALTERLAKEISRADLAASVQKVAEDVTLKSLQRLLSHHPSRNLGLSGGLFANVKLNRLLAETLPIDEIFIFPAMADEGLPVGGVLAHLLQEDGLATWLGKRRPLGPVYLGRDYSGAIDTHLTAIPGVRLVTKDGVAESVKRLEAGQLGAVYTGRMEYGPRALGARSILANPARRETHDLLNERLSRSEFMPFAPVITAKRAADVFDINPVNARACRYMTIACDVRSEWRSKIPAVVHVDGSARPQIIERDDNPLYYDIIDAFDRATGLGALVNTSFNVHEEPIVDTPAQCSKALLDGRVDFIVTERGLYDYGSR
jgi:carbamoyltransferase